MFETFTQRLIHRSPYQWYESLQRKHLNKPRIDTFDQDHPCVFVLSTGRVGTTTLASLFELATNVFAYHEPSPELVGLSTLAYEYANETAAREILRESFVTMRKSLFNYSLSCNKGYVETGPYPTFLAPIILEAVPNARFIHLIRDPKDVIKSGMKRKWYAGHAEDRTRIIPLADTDASRQWPTCTPIQKIAWLWTETNKWIQEFCDLLPSDRALLIYAEDVFAHDTETIEKLFGFISAPLPSNRKIARVLGQKLNAQKTGSFPASDSWKSELAPEFMVNFYKTAQDFGYGTK